MAKNDPPWLWRCPHCLGGLMSLRSASRHLRRRHHDCWSCRVERIMVQAMMEGHGFQVVDGPWFGKHGGDWWQVESRA